MEKCTDKRRLLMCLLLLPMSFKRSTSRAVPQKIVFPTTFQLACKFWLYSLEIWAFWGTLFLKISSFSQWEVEIVNSKLFNLLCKCIISCYLQNMIGNLVVFSILISSKGVLFSVPSWLEKEKQPSWFGKNEHLFAKF